MPELPQTETSRKKLISLVVPVFNESKNIAPLYETVCQLFTEKLGQFDFELLLVNDGSVDDSAKLISALCQKDSRVRGVILSRNFGKEIALSAGVDFATGDATVFMDADLQHPPELIPRMIEEWLAGAQIVATIRKSVQKHGIVRRASSRTYYWLINLISELELISQTTDFRLLDRQVVRELRKIHEKNRMFRALVDWMGFEKVWLEFEAPARVHGTSNYSYIKLFDLALTSMISYTQTPLRLVAVLGFLITTASFFSLVWMSLAFHLVSEQFYYTPLAKVVVFNSFLMGIMMACLGVVSLYIGKIYSEVIRRPLYIVQKAIGFQNATESNSPEGA